MKTFPHTADPARAFDGDFARRLQALKEGLLPYLKGKTPLLEESPTGQELSPEPDSPRAYSPGDDIRHVDWNLYARLDRLYLKSVVREEEVPFLFLLDTSESMWSPEPGKFLKALKVTAALADIFLSLGHRIVIVPWSTRIGGIHGPFTGEHELEAVLHLLSTIRTGGTSNLRTALRESLPIQSASRTSPVILSDFLFPLDYRREIGYLTARNLPATAIQILSREERSYRPRGNLVLVDPETGREERLHAGYRTSHTYREAFQRHLDDTQAAFSLKGGLFHRTRSSRSFEKIVRTLLA